MTLTILASVSLLALVSSARPLPEPDDHWNGLQVSGVDENVQQVVQALVKSYGSLRGELKEEDDVHVQLASTEEMQAYLSTADGDVIKALIPLEEGVFHSPDEKELSALLNRLEDERRGGSPVPDEVLDSISDTASSSTLQSVEPPSDVSGAKSGKVIPSVSSKPVVVMVASCAIAFLAVCCVAAALYLIETLRKSVFRSAWDSLPQLENSTTVSYSGRKHFSVRGAAGMIQSDPDTEKMPGAFVAPLPFAATSQLDHPSSRASFLGEDAEGSEFGDDGDEKFFDAESVELSDSPHASSRTASTELLSLGLPAVAAATVTVAAVAAVRSPEVRERQQDSSGPRTVTSRPSWSSRASEAQALVHAHECRNGNDQRQRGETSTTPQLDAALAMQLRPGLGIGADAAWLVRFIMALFGWCAVLMSGGRR